MDNYRGGGSKRWQVGRHLGKKSFAITAGEMWQGKQATWKGQVRYCTVRNVAGGDVAGGEVGQSTNDIKT